jgi:hypothetical protein
VQDARVRLGGQQVVRREAPVEVDADGQPREGLGGPALEAAAPERGALGGGGGHRRSLPAPCRRTAGGGGAHPPSRRSRCAAILLGIPHSSTKPLASDWSKVSSASYVARLKS